MWMTTRDDLGQMLNQLGLLGVGVEVGVLKGHLSRRILDVWNGKTLLMVDPWEKQPDDVYTDIDNTSDEVQKDRMQTALQSVKYHEGRYELIRGYSVQVAAQLPDDSLDFVYLDARHDYESVLEDLAAWYPKVRSGGLFGGHDFLDGQFLIEGDDGEKHLTSYGVGRAVREFSIQVRQNFSVTSKDSPFESWYFIKH
jgi:hypothetical protein